MLLAVSVLCCVLTYARSVIFAQRAIASSSGLHDSVFYRVLHAPVNTFFDTTPMGRILNRFSKDQDTVDTIPPVSVMIVCAASNLWFLLCFVPILYLFFRKTNG